MEKIKTIAKLYGGDATKKDELTYGDVLVIELLETAISLLQKRGSKGVLKIEIPSEQQIHLPISACSLTFFNMFSKAKIKILYGQGIIRTTKVIMGDNQIKIYTHKY